MLTLFGLWLPLLVTGSVFVESVFAWPGLGSLAVGAVGYRDYPLLMGTSLLVAVVVVSGSLLMDLAYALPRSSGAALVTVLLEPLRRACRTPRGRAGAIVLVAIALAAIFAPPLLPDPLAQPDPIGGVSLAPSARPSVRHRPAEPRRARERRVGGPSLARGRRCIAVGLSVTLGALVGLVAGYWGGVVDAALMRLVDGALAIPRLFLLLLVLAMSDRVPVWLLDPADRRHRMVRHQPHRARGSAAPARGELRAGIGGAGGVAAPRYLPASAAQHAGAAAGGRRRWAWAT